MSYELWFFPFQIYESVGPVWWRFLNYFTSIFVADYGKSLNPGRGTRFFASPKPSESLQCSESLLFIGQQSPLAGDERIEAWIYLSPSVTEVKKEWSYTSTPYIRLHGVDRDKFTSFYILRKPCKFSWTLDWIFKIQKCGGFPL
jgi:hypothetical protein